MLKSLKSTVTAFDRNEDGTIAVMFGACLVMMVGIVGLAIDGGRAMSAQAKAASALDAAALAATRALYTSGMNDAEVEAYARDFFNSNVDPDGAGAASFEEPQVIVDRRTKTIRLVVNTHVPTTFGRVFGLSDISFATDTVATFNVNDIELSMALDVTGSMRGQKLADLKVAAENLIDTLIPDSGTLGEVRIALAPYDASVNVGGLAAAASNGASEDNCVVERTGRYAYTDAAPGAGSFFDASTAAAPVRDIDPFEGLVGARSNYGYSCPSASILPLTNDKDVLKTRIDSLRDGGYTAGHMGAAWAWYMISENWAGLLPLDSEPGAYGKANLIKAVVFMTDGVFNTSFRNGSSRDQALDQCEAMKAEGITVYTVSFKSPRHPTLLACASTDPDTGNPNYYEADNGSELNEAFQDIAIKLTALRLAK